MAKVGKLVFSVECLFALLFLLTAVPLAGLGRSLIKPSPALLTFVVFGGYCWLALGFVVYLYGAVVAALGKASTFWHSFLPPILGLPVMVWGLGKLQTTTNLTVVISASLVTVLLAAAIATRTPATRWRALPALLLVGVLVTADLTVSGWINVFIGTALLTIPIFLWLFERRKHA